ncbi:MAG: hypothetical protein GY940_05880 [bacterium]|nr:hypothetical protein [bacterium]
MQAIQEGLEKFKTHYRERLGPLEYETIENQDGIKARYTLKSPLLKEGNGPTIFSHRRKTKEVLVMTHGLSDSPYYVKAIARRFYAEGVNVIMPLLPAHGLIDPDKAMEDYKMDAKWRKEIDHAVDVAVSFGDRVSLGGFSTGGGLSLNKILRTPDQIKGGLFLFSGALDLGLVVDEVSRIKLVQSIVKIVDGKIKGIGRDPYKYPELPKFAGLELGQIINENDKLIKNKKISQPVFSSHSAQDTTVKIHGIIDLLEHHVKKGFSFIIGDNVPHAELVLEKDIPLDYSQTDGPKEPPKANPDFDWMMENVLRFFKHQVAGL